MPIRSRISSELEALNALHILNSWIPNETMIRPNQKILKDKAHFSNYVLYYWMSFKDFILDTHFKYPVDIDDGQIYVIKKVEKSEWNFTQSLFPYDLPAGTHHYVLWNSFYDYTYEVEDDKINEIINETLNSMLGHDMYDFAWYKNPKPSIPELWHCQVFWIRA